MNVEQLVEWELTGESEILGENLPHCHLVHKKSHMKWHGIEPPGRCNGKPGKGELSSLEYTNIIVFIFPKISVCGDTMPNTLFIYLWRIINGTEYIRKR
jgi:hypothetical protein